MIKVNTYAYSDLELANLTEYLIISAIFIFISSVGTFIFWKKIMERRVRRMPAIVLESNNDIDHFEEVMPAVLHPTK